MSTVQLRRDPFARMTLMRASIGANSQCAWCGSRPGRFYYWWEADSIYRHERPTCRFFCSVGCWEAYHA